MRAGLVYRAMGFPPQFFTVLFAIPRVTGYVAHWREQLSDPDVKIVRPQQIYQVSCASLYASLQECCLQYACKITIMKLIRYRTSASIGFCLAIALPLPVALTSQVAIQHCTEGNY